MAQIISFSIPKGNELQIEDLQKTLGLKGKSEVVRAAIRSLANETQEHSKMKGVVDAIIVASHAHDESLEKTIHAYESLVKTHMHQHVGAKCVELFMLKGKAENIISFYNSLSKNKQTISVKLLVV